MTCGPHVDDNVKRTWKRSLTIVLALETSCDETAVALVDGHQVLANVVASQVASHAPYGGVVPELAARRHVELLPHLVDQAFGEAGIDWDDVNAVAATATPGLVGALLVGLTTGKTMALIHGKPFLAVHHLEGHLCSAQLTGGPPPPEPPFLVLLVSGGHTQLVRVDGPGTYQLCGATVDDAAGEAFDKVARLLGLDYPGGPAVEAVAGGGDPRRFAFPQGRVGCRGGGYEPYAFSFSGLKTAVLRCIEGLQRRGEPLPVADLAASFEFTVATVLSSRSVCCALDQGLSRLVVVGGVAANRRLRQALEQRCREEGITLALAPLAFCGDNAAMIGVAAGQRLASGCQSPWTIGVSPRLPLQEAGCLYSSQPPF